MLPFMTATFGNAASRDHAFGWDAAEAVEEARSQVAGLINARTEEIIFTSGATEAVNFVLKGVRKKNFITWSAEHEAVLETSAQLASCLGIHVTQLRVDRTGQLDFGQCKELLRKQDGTLVALMVANNETGVIHPVQEVAKI